MGKSWTTQHWAKLIFSHNPIYRLRKDYDVNTDDTLDEEPHEEEEDEVQECDDAISIEEDDKTLLPNDILRATRKIEMGTCNSSFRSDPRAQNKYLPEVATEGEMLTKDKFNQYGSIPGSTSFNVSKQLASSNLKSLKYDDM